MPLIETHMRVARYQFTSFDAVDQVQASVPNIIASEPQNPDFVALLEPELIPPPPSFSEQELEQASKAAFQEGYNAGQQEAESKRNKANEENAATMRTLLNVIANRITLASEEHMHFVKSQQDTTLKMTLAIARKIAGDALKRQPYASVETLLKECANLIAGEQRIVIAVSPEKSDGLRQSIDALKPHLHDFDGEIIIEQDATLAEHDCKVEWKNGQAAHNAEAVWNAIESLLKKTTLTT